MLMHAPYHSGNSCLQSYQASKALIIGKNQGRLQKKNKLWFDLLLYCIRIIGPLEGSTHLFCKIHYILQGLQLWKVDPAERFN